MKRDRDDAEDAYHRYVDECMEFGLDPHKALFNGGLQSVKARADEIASDERGGRHDTNTSQQRGTKNNRVPDVLLHKDPEDV